MIFYEKRLFILAFAFTISIGIQASDAFDVEQTVLNAADMQVSPANSTILEQELYFANSTEANSTEAHHIDDVNQSANADNDVTISLFNVLGSYLKTVGNVASSSLYYGFDTLGSIADLLLARGDLSEENQKIFAEMAAKLGIADRNIKAKNSGLILRWYFGYHNALALQPLNRVYLNDGVLNEWPDDVKRFIIAHELSHHYHHHIFQSIIVSAIINNAKVAAILFALRKGFIADSAGENNFLKRYMTYGPVIAIERLSKYFIADFTIWGLIKAQNRQRQETEADTTAIAIAGVSPKTAAKALTLIRYPATDNWPLDAQFQNWALSRILDFMSLPIIKQHFHHLASLPDRVAHVMSLEDEWKEKHGEKRT